MSNTQILDKSMTTVVGGAKETAVKSKKGGKRSGGTSREGSAGMNKRLGALLGGNMEQPGTDMLTRSGGAGPGNILL